MARSSWILLIGLVATVFSSQGSEPVVIRVPLDESWEVGIDQLVSRVAARAGVSVDRTAASLRLPLDGLAGALTRRFLNQCLGSDVTISVQARELIVSLPPEQLAPSQLPALRDRLNDLARQARDEAQRRMSALGMHANPSYRPNDPQRPTVCLIHGLNSTSRVFVHMVGPLEEAGFGVVFYNFPYNRDLDATARAFGKDWLAFREKMGERRPWAIVTHSMGGLLARWYVEADPRYAHDVSDLIMIAPPNHGSDLSGAQALLQLIQGVKAVNQEQASALAKLSDGLGAAAEDLTPGSAFLRALNQHPRREGVRYHILAGDAGPLNPTTRDQIEAQLRVLTRGKGLIGGLARFATGEVTARLDEMTEGSGDGCVAVASTRLDGVADHQTIHANHVELIRGPLFYPDPGPVACMPFVLRWLDSGRGVPKDAVRP
jgi:pimeloyl-ACP methyl ester carboxylesterase